MFYRCDHNDFAWEYSSVLALYFVLQVVLLVLIVDHLVMCLIDHDLMAFPMVAPVVGGSPAYESSFVEECLKTPCTEWKQTDWSVVFDV